MTDRSIPPGFWTVWTSVAVDLVGFGIIIPLLPLYAEQFGASPLVIGLLFASYSLAQFVFSPIWGRVSDRIGRKPVLLVTIAGSAIGSLILGLAGSVIVLFIGRIVDGVSGASLAVARATVADVADAKDRPRLMGLLGAAFGLGFVVGPAIGGLAALGGPAVPFFVAGGISVVNLGLAAIRLPETKSAASPALSKRPSPLAVRGGVARLVAITFAAITAFSAFEATFSLLGSDRLDMSSTTVAFTFAALGVALVVVQGGIVGPLTARLGETAVIRASLVANLVGFIVLAIAQSWVALGIGLAALAVGQGLLTPVLSSAIAGMSDPENVGATLGAQQSAGGLARVVGPAAGGLLYAIGTPWPYVASAVITIAVLPFVRLPGSATHRTRADEAVV